MMEEIDRKYRIKLRVNIALGFTINTHLWF